MKNPKDFNKKEKKHISNSVEQMNEKILKIYQ